MSFYVSRVAALVGFVVAAVAAADVPARHYRVAERVLPHDQWGASAGTCTIKYYNICSGWTWSWAWGIQSEEAGVFFDLPTDCGKSPGERCVNTGFWWYWWFTYPGYGYTVTYRLYDLDASLCKVGEPIGYLEQEDPVNRWNYYPGLGMTQSDRVAITASLDLGGCPYIVTDNNVSNQQVGCASVPTVVHSVYYGTDFSQYCPPLQWVDQLGLVNILMDATFSCEATATEPSSWGAIKTLFR